MARRGTLECLWPPMFRLPRYRSRCGATDSLTVDKPVERNEQIVARHRFLVFLLRTLRIYDSARYRSLLISAKNRVRFSLSSMQTSIRLAVATSSYRANLVCGSQAARQLLVVIAKLADHFLQTHSFFVVVF